MASGKLVYLLASYYKKGKIKFLKGNFKLANKIGKVIFPWQVFGRSVDNLKENWQGLLCGKLYFAIFLNLPTKFVRFFWWQVGLLVKFFKRANKTGKLAKLPTKLAS